MPVGAVIGGAALTAGATVATGAMASHAQTKAANQASSDAQATAAENNQLARDTYNANASRLDPYSRMGLATGDEYTRLLLGDNFNTGVTPSTGQPAPVAAPAPTGPTMAQILAMRHDGIPGNFKSALASLGTQPTAQSALTPFSITQQAQSAIAQGADPAAVKARAASMGVTI